MNYKKSQIGWFAIWTFVPAILLMYLFYLNQWGNEPIPFSLFLFMAGMFLLILALFYQLTVEIEGNVVKLTYGIGLIRMRFAMDELLETRVITTPWYYGLGIRITPKGMLYNIHGRKAVEITYIHKGIKKSLMVGSLEPEVLKESLEKAMR